MQDEDVDGQLLGMGLWVVHDAKNLHLLLDADDMNRIAITSDLSYVWSGRLNIYSLRISLSVQFFSWFYGSCIWSIGFIALFWPILIRLEHVCTTILIAEL